jgi:N-acetylglucosaminyl-diphospho-decaprenol L-rhamnosyltransferase
LPALLVSYSSLLGGAERFLLDLAAGLDTTPALACPEGPLADQARAAGLHVIALPRRSLDLRASARDRLAAPARVAAHARELRSLVEALEPDVVVTSGMRTQLAAAALGASRPPLVFMHHDLLPSPLVGRAVRTAARRADVVVAVSECVARDLDPSGALRTQVINPGVDLARFELSPPPAGPPEVLVLGAIVPWKRPDMALDVIALAAGELPDLRVRVAGEPIGAEGERLLAMLRRRAEQPDLDGRVEFAGSVDAADALRRATCLLHCAEREPFGIVLAEALAAARPVVAPASCGPAEIVDESCGRLYQPADTEAAARLLVEAIRNSQALGAAGRARAEGRYSVEKAQKEYRQLLGDLLPDTRHPTPDTRISLVTVTHNSERDIVRLLSSVNTHLPEAQVIVVDSASSDGSAEVAAAHGAHVIRLDRNVGFGRGSNAGVEAATQPVTVVVNPDVELVDDSLAQLASELAGSDRLLAPLVLLPDGSRQDSAQAEPGTAQALAIAIVPPLLMPGPLRRAACPWTDGRPRKVGWAVGCCVAARTDTLRRLGPFDERAFMYGEDLDLGLRAGDAGIETWFRPEARVIHHHAHSTREHFGGEPYELLARRRRAVVAERRGRTRMILDDLLQAATFADRIAVKALTRRDTTREREQLRALRRARRSPGS